MKLSQDDMYSLGYDLEKVALFHSEPLEVRIDGLEPFKVGEGFGGFHWSIFVRGEDCTACGACCKQCRRRTWWWHDSEPHPKDDTVDYIAGSINGVEVPFVYHLTKSGNRYETCDYLVPQFVDGPEPGIKLPMLEQNDRQVHYCSLHVNGTKPLHCRMDPFMSVHSVKRGQGRTNLLGRRLPPRNWRWPQCPIVVDGLPLSQQVIDADRRNFKQLQDTWGNLPGSRMREGFELWEKRLAEVREGKYDEKNITSVFLDEVLK